MKQKVVFSYGPVDVVAAQINSAIEMGWFVQSVTKSDGPNWLIVLYAL